MATSIRPVCSAAVPPPIPRERSGARNPSSRKNTPAMPSSQCWPVSMKTSSCRSRSAGCRAAALMSWGRVPTTLARRIRSIVQATEAALAAPTGVLPATGRAASQATMSSAMRTPAWPSHNGGRRPGRTHRPGQDRPGRLDDLGRRDQPVRALADGDRPLGVRPHRQARDVEDRGLLLDPARIGQHEPGAGHERQERDVAQRLDDADPVAAVSPAASRFAPPRGWSGITSGTRAASPSSASTTARASAASSTFDGRWSVTTP